MKKEKEKKKRKWFENIKRRLCSCKFKVFCLISLANRARVKGFRRFLLYGHIHKKHCPRRRPLLVIILTIETVSTSRALFDLTTL